jgi:hypothetical protein
MVRKSRSNLLVPKTHFTFKLKKKTLCRSLKKPICGFKIGKNWSQSQKLSQALIYCFRQEENQKTAQ